MVRRRSRSPFQHIFERMRGKGDENKKDQHRTWIMVDDEWVPTMQGFWEQMSATRCSVDRVDTKSNIAILIAAVSALVSIVLFFIS